MITELFWTIPYINQVIHCSCYTVSIVLQGIKHFTLNINTSQVGNFIGCNKNSIVNDQYTSYM